MRTSDRRPSGDPIRWVWRGSALAVLLIGWIFIFIHNSGHITPPVVFIGLGYFAGVATIYNLFRTGASAVATETEEDGAAWGLPLGERGELEREKRTLLKAIKEAEFDHQMGKLSKADVDDMIKQYRGRAIAVIKLLEDPGTKKSGTTREQIEREVRARLEVEGAGRKKIELSSRKNQQKAAEAAKHAARAAAAAGASGPAAAAIAAAASVQTDEDEEADDPVDAKAPTIEATIDAKPEPKIEAKPEPKFEANGDAKAETKPANPGVAHVTATDTSDVEPRARDKEASR